MKVKQINFDSTRRYELIIVDLELLFGLWQYSLFYAANYATFLLQTKKNNKMQYLQ